MAREFFYAVSYAAAMNLHLKVMYGENDHHKLEAMFKAFAKALDAASRPDPRIQGVLSHQGHAVKGVPAARDCRCRRDRDCLRFPAGRGSAFAYKPVTSGPGPD